MQKHELAEQLRERQRKAKHVPVHLIDLLSDDAIIDSYITCSCCGEKQVDEQQLELAINSAKDSETFFEICDRFSSQKQMKH
ncbi:MAG: hypothetical protein L0229_00060 [Blastocatellia bacterium]|nr:hypothetical protein [Blastocatellia bacterium]